MQIETTHLREKEMKNIISVIIAFLMISVPLTLKAQEKLHVIVQVHDSTNPFWSEMIIGEAIKKLDQNPVLIDSSYYGTGSDQAIIFEVACLQKSSGVEYIMRGIKPGSSGETFGYNRISLAGSLDCFTGLEVGAVKIAEAINRLVNQKKLLRSSSNGSCKENRDRDVPVILMSFFSEFCNLFGPLTKHSVTYLF